MTEEHDFLFKCICIGDGGCGKTALVVRFSKGFFQEQYKLTIGVDFAIKTFKLKNGKKIKLQIWDTGGQERFDFIRSAYYRGAMGVVIMFDLSNRESFDHLPKWIEEVKSNIGDLPMLIVGNKNDLVNERLITYEEAEQFAREFNLYYIESSAKKDNNVGDVFKMLSYLMLELDIPNKLLNKIIIKPIIETPIFNIPIPKLKIIKTPIFVTCGVTLPNQQEIEASIPIIPPRKIKNYIELNPRISFINRLKHNNK